MQPSTTTASPQWLMAAVGLEKAENNLLIADLANREACVAHFSKNEDPLYKKVHCETEIVVGTTKLTYDR